LSTLLVASTGGHLKELHHLHRRLAGIGGPFRWVTFDTPQSRSLLDGEAVDFVPFVGGRDPANVTRNLVSARRILRQGDVTRVVSTGSAVALPFFGVARARRLRCHYIESAARIDGPSITGSLISRIPGVHLYAQHRRWSHPWGYGGSVFDSFEPAARTHAPSGIGRVVVTLGTYRGYEFPRVVQRLLEVLPAEAEVLWQTGDTDTSGMGIDGHYAIPEHELMQAMREADVVVTHAGVGSALAVLEAGKIPLLVPRRLSLGEHVDDHQIQLARELGDRGLAIAVEADAIESGHLAEAAASVAATVDRAPVFETVEE
jgi:UDP-N-acetylglucosamine--N-acetylmuramyl-(pentapeptide) pyrophosphoryl-undecaprenol N-acetylglucosamine transferase